MYNYRTILAIFLSLLIIVIWQLLFDVFTNSKQYNTKNIEIYNYNTSTYKKKTINKNSILSRTKRVTFNNEYIKGSINLIGAKIDDLILLKYIKNIDSNKNIKLLSPARTYGVQYAEFGWVSNNSNIELPNSKTKWIANIQHLTSKNKLNLTWKNSKDIKFNIKISLDNKYMFKIEQFIFNNQNTKITPFALITRDDNNNGDNETFIHEGGIATFNNQLKEISFKKLNSIKKVIYKNKNKGWIGFSNKYWLTSIIFQENSNNSFSSYRAYNVNKYQVDNIAEKKSCYRKIFFFSGAKKLNIFDFYSKKYKIALFDHAIDFGKLYFITKPIFLLLNFFYSLLGNFGSAILLLTIIIKLILFPLAYKGFLNMNKFKKLQPSILKLKQLYQKEKNQLQHATLALYKKEKINPISGCLPVFLQLLISFALYKVLYITIEMRQAPFFGWVKDLSMSDPSNIFTLFGLINWQPPSILQLGILPIVMSITIFLQQKFNFQTSDTTQTQIAQILPFIFLFLFTSLPSGLLIYWSWSNILTIIQQIIIQKLNNEYK